MHIHRPEACTVNVFLFISLPILIFLFSFCIFLYISSHLNYQKVTQTHAKCQTTCKKYQFQLCWAAVSWPWNKRFFSWVFILSSSNNNIKKEANSILKSKHCLIWKNKRPQGLHSYWDKEIRDSTHNLRQRFDWGAIWEYKMALYNVVHVMNVNRL